MADGSAAAPAAGDAGGAATGADAGAAAAANAGATGAPGGGAGTAAVAAAVQEAPWHGELDADMQGWLQNKAWFGTDIAKADVRKAFPEMARAYRSLESVVGRDKIAVPKEGAPKEELDAFYSKIGRPADPAGYELKAGEGGDQKIADDFAVIAHELGLSKSQAQGMAAKWDAKATALATANAANAERAYLSNSTAEVEGLKQEWGQQADHKFAAAQRVKVALGWSEEKMDKIERAVGTKEFLTDMAALGAMVSEDNGPGTGNAAQSATTPEAARARLKELGEDKAWVAKYQANDADAVAEKRRLDHILADAAARG